jgi:hypothetical protein
VIDFSHAIAVSWPQHHHAKVSRRTSGVFGAWLMEFY